MHHIFSTRTLNEDTYPGIIKQTRYFNICQNRVKVRHAEATRTYLLTILSQRSTQLILVPKKQSLQIIFDYNFNK